MSRVAEAD